MLRVILMRHAKSSWKTDAPTDHARPLNKRGRKAAPKVAAQLARMGWAPELVVSSDSTRTRETFARMELGVEAVFLEDLYHAGPEAVGPILRAFHDKVTSVLLLGHNPGWEEVLTWLSGSDEELKTGCAALLERDVERWADAAGPGWQLRAMIRPREL
ncbi:MAG: histidine phosphatase family protein [Sandaracinaceae bacterium]